MTSKLTFNSKSLPPSQKSRVKQVNDKGQPAPFECLEDEIPYASLCSLAIYKLYEDWTADGVDLGSEMYEFRGNGRILARSNIEASCQLSFLLP